MKQADLGLPAPLRWLTRLFSSITLAVTLLACVVLYGTIASVPVAFIASAVVYGGVILGCTVLTLLAAAALCSGVGPCRSLPVWARAVGGGLIIAAGVVAILLAIPAIRAELLSHPWFLKYRATVIYRLPSFEMTELEFYSWWPLKVVLCLFVVNLVWATIRRIEFKFLNIGVLTVHTGIITIAIGSVIYYSTKVEGDAIVFRDDFGGMYVHNFYDGTTPAMYFASEAGKTIMVPMDDLPRYNDYDDRTGLKLNIPLHEAVDFDKVMGPNVRATIRNFIAYGTLTTQWTASDPDERPADLRLSNPAIELKLGDGTAPDPSLPAAMLVSGLPSKRVMEASNWAVELLADPSRQRLADLTSEFKGMHGLVVEIPSQGFREVYSITPGQSIAVGDTGFTLDIENIGPYGMSFATAGYQGATDTRATVRVTHGDEMFRRIAMHRYPERSQDFVPAPGDTGVGPMGRRTDPNPIIHLAYIDASKLQIRLIIKRGAPDERPQLLLRLPDDRPMLVTPPDDRFPIGSDRWLHIAQRIPHAVQREVPVPTPANERAPKDEGTYLHALLPIDLEVDVPQPDGTTKLWSKRIWLRHMRYPGVPVSDDEVRDAFNEGRDRVVNIPTVGNVKLMFSRKQHDLGFAVQLVDFKMTPYPGSQIPRDYQSQLTIRHLDKTTGRFIGDPTTGITRLNNPLLYGGLKLSQTGWDPGSQEDPNRMRRDGTGRYTNQQRFSILGVGNNRGIHIIFVGCCLMVLGIPWAFYIKPLLVHRRKLQIQREVAAGTYQPKKADKTRKVERKQKPATVQS